MPLADDPLPPSQMHELVLLEAYAGDEGAVGGWQ